MYVAAT